MTAAPAPTRQLDNTDNHGKHLLAVSRDHTKHAH